jgi:hypothetical protein
MLALNRLFALATLGLAAFALPACSPTDSSVGGSNQDKLNAECKPGETKKADDGCNTCSCQQNGFWACTEMGCVDPNACKPGDTKKADDGCNTCSCTDDGAWACTEMGCVDPNACKPGDTKKADDGCNTCSCQPDGSWACTEIGCVPECKPGDTKKADDGCNTCVCGDDNTWACTKIGCVPECKAQDAKGVGACAAFFGYAWNGSSCVGLGGCDCEGADCKSTFNTPEECQKAYASCGSGGCDGFPPPCAPPPAGCDYVGGGCVNGSWTCGELVCGNQCKSDADCSLVGGAPCELCADESAACPSSKCVAGQCQLDFPSCPGGGVKPGAPCDKPGAEAPADDGCNTCVCSKDNTWACTKIACGGECKAQDAEGIGPCDAFFSYAWNGKECVGLSGCSCKGTDCKNTFNTPKECQKAYASCGCDGFPPPCAPPPAGCDYVGGGCVKGSWTCGELVCGNQCKSDADCPVSNQACLKCQGISTCPKAICDMGQCVNIPPSCGDSCEPQDAKGDDGLCEAWFGYFWNGKECVGFSGCSCKGADCDNAYASQAICEAVHSSCN